MAGKQPRLKVILADDAIDQLDDIWRWNAERYGSAHADKYSAFLKRSIDALDKNYFRGKPIEAHPELRYILVRRKNRGHGHVAVYTFDSQSVDVLNVFHSAQDWPSKIN